MAEFSSHSDSGHWWRVTTCYLIYAILYALTGLSYFSNTLAYVSNVDEFTNFMSRCRGVRQRTVTRVLTDKTHSITLRISAKFHI